MSGKSNLSRFVRLRKANDSDSVGTSVEPTRNSAARSAGNSTRESGTSRIDSVLKSKIIAPISPRKGSSVVKESSPADREASDGNSSTTPTAVVPLPVRATITAWNEKEWKNPLSDSDSGTSSSTSSDDAEYAYTEYSKSLETQLLAMERQRVSPNVASVQSHHHLVWTNEASDADDEGENAESTNVSEAEVSENVSDGSFYGSGSGLGEDGIQLAAAFLLGIQLDEVVECQDAEIQKKFREAQSDSNSGPVFQWKRREDGLLEEADHIEHVVALLKAAQRFLCGMRLDGTIDQSVEVLNLNYVGKHSSSSRKRNTGDNSETQGSIVVHKKGRRRSQLKTMVAAEGNEDAQTLAGKTVSDADQVGVDSDRLPKAEQRSDGLLVVDSADPVTTLGNSNAGEPDSTLIDAKESSDSEGEGEVKKKKEKKPTKVLMRSGHLDEAESEKLQSSALNAEVSESDQEEHESAMSKLSSLGRPLRLRDLDVRQMEAVLERRMMHNAILGLKTPTKEQQVLDEIKSSSSGAVRNLGKDFDTAALSKSSQTILKRSKQSDVGDDGTVDTTDKGSSGAPKKRDRRRERVSDVALSGKAFLKTIEFYQTHGSPTPMSAAALLAIQRRRVHAGLSPQKRHTRTCTFSVIPFVKQKVQDAVFNGALDSLVKLATEAQSVDAPALHLEAIARRIAVEKRAKSSVGMSSGAGDNAGDALLSSSGRRLTSTLSRQESAMSGRELDNPVESNTESQTGLSSAFTMATSITAGVRGFVKKHTGKLYGVSWSHLMAPAYVSSFYRSAQPQVLSPVADSYPMIPSTYEPFFLDDPELKTGKHRTVMNLQGFKASVMPYVHPKVLKADLNAQFQQRHPWMSLAAPPVSLSRLRKVKRAILETVLEGNLELSTAALAYVYLDKLILNLFANKTNVYEIGAVCLVVAAKFSDPTFDLLPIQILKTAIRTSSLRIMPSSLVKSSGYRAS